jgi:hypothetical protein
MRQESVQVAHEVSRLGGDSSRETHEHSLLVVPVSDLVIAESQRLVEPVIVGGLNEPILTSSDSSTMTLFPKLMFVTVYKLIKVNENTFFLN